MKSTIKQNEVDGNRTQLLFLANKDEYFYKEELEYYAEYKHLLVQGKKALTGKNWQKGDVIGQGAFGRVYLGLDNNSGEIMAVKQVPLSELGNNANLNEKVQALEVEIDILSQLEHKNIVKYIGTSRDDKFINVFMEYEAGGSISTLLQKYHCFKESLIKLYTRQILDGLEYLHVHNVIHRDIKGGNVLVHSNGVCKLADFGGAKKIAIDSKGQFNSLKGTPYWMAPEVIRQEGSGRQADIWSVGCTIIEMANGVPPWSEYKNHYTALFHIANNNSPPIIPPQLSPLCRDFISHCLERNPKARWNVFKLLRHPFLDSKNNQNEH